VYRMASHKYDRQVTRLRSNQADKRLGLQEWSTSVRPTSLQRAQADNAAYEALRTSTTTQAWEACVLYGQSQVWPTSNQAEE